MLPRQPGPNSPEQVCGPSVWQPHVDSRACLGFAPEALRHWKEGDLVEETHDRLDLNPTMQPLHFKSSQSDLETRPS